MKNINLTHSGSVWSVLQKLSSTNLIKGDKSSSGILPTSVANRLVSSSLQFNKIGDKG